MRSKTILPILFCSVLLLLAGCWESSLTFQVRYAEISGLQNNDPVYFAQNKIGTVGKITYTGQGDYLVTITIAPEFTNAATVDAKFYIDADPNDQNGKAVTLVQEKPGGGAMAKGAIVLGSVRAGLLEEVMSGFKRTAAVAGQEMRKAMTQLEKSLASTSRQLNTEMAGALDDLSRQLQTYRGEAKKVPDNTEVRQLETSIRQFAEEFRKTQQDVRNQIRDEVLPQLRKELDQLREQLHKEGREQEMEEIDKQVKEMVSV